MKRVVVDTNVALSFLSERNLEQQERAAQLFEDAAAGRVVLYLHQVVLTELVSVLRSIYHVDSAGQAKILGDLLALPGVEPVHDTAWQQVLTLWPSQIADFGDAILACAAGTESIATFDERFIKRLRTLGRAVWE